MEAKTTVSTAELRPLVSALKNEMQKTKPPFRTYIADQKKQEAR